MISAKFMVVALALVALSGALFLLSGMSGIFPLIVLLWLAEIVYGAGDIE